MSIKTHHPVLFSPPLKKKKTEFRRDRGRKRRKRRKSVHKEEKWENFGEVELPPEIAGATTARGHASLSPVFADQGKPENRHAFKSSFGRFSKSLITS